MNEQLSGGTFQIPTAVNQSPERPQEFAAILCIMFYNGLNILSAKRAGILTVGCGSQKTVNTHFFVMEHAV